MLKFFHMDASKIGLENLKTIILIRKDLSI